MRNVYDLIPARQALEWEVTKDNPYIFLKKIEDDLIWMSNVAFEIGTHERYASEVTGDVLIVGLGLGYNSIQAEDKKDVTSITIVEKEEEVIELVAEHIAHRKVTVVHDSILHYFETLRNNVKYDYIWFDIFPNDPIYFPEEVALLTDLAERHLKGQGKIRFWKLYKPLEL